MPDNSNYWKLQGTVKKLKEKDNRCFICGYRENIVPHHLKQVKNTSEEYYSENNIVLLCDYHHHNYHHKYSNVNIKTFCEYLRDNFIIHIKENEMNNVKKKRRVNMDIDLNEQLKVTKLNKMMKIINKHMKKTVKVSVEDMLYGIGKIRDQNEVTILEIRGFEEGFDVPNNENDNFVIHVDYNDELKLSKFRKILGLVSKKNVLKVSIKNTLYDIVQIKDRQDELIFVVDLKKNMMET